jgi:hypothetical protein
MAKQVLKSDFNYFCMNNYDSANGMIMTGEKDAKDEVSIFPKLILLDIRRRCRHYSKIHHTSQADPYVYLH